MSSSVLLLLLYLLLCQQVWSYEAPKGKQEEFATKVCPAFLTFTNVAYLDGVTVELPCHCKPHQIQSVVWFFKKHLDGAEKTRVLTDHHGNTLLDSREVPHSGDLRSRFSIRLFSLLIFRAGPDDSGIYICGSTHQDFFYAYDLDIQKARSITHSLGVTTESENTQQDVIRGRRSAQPLYQVFIRFRPWSLCDRCGVPGEQVRVGLCYVRSKYLHVRYTRVNQTVASCASGAVPWAFRGLRQRWDGAKFEVRGCQVTCPPPPPPAPKLLTLMALLGHSSSSVPIEVPVLYLNHPEDTVLTMGCPGARPTMAVAWDHESEPIYRFKHLAGSAAPSRLQIDTGHHLVFNPAKIQDSGVYYCWLQGRKAAQIHLLVYVHFGQERPVTSHPDFPAAMKTFLLSCAALVPVFILCVFIKAGLKHIRRTAENRDG